VLLVALVVFTGWRIHEHGAQSEKDRQELQQLRTSLKAAEHSLADYQSRVLEVQKLAEARAQSSERIRTVTKEILREVHVRIPADACPLPPGFRVLHDAAAQGQHPAPASGADATPVPAQDAADTVVENYGQYHDIADRLLKLQQYVREQLNEKH
jgi:hypothetical protein